ncbi:MAG: hypothetical protein K5756_01290 [Clostridiales bacterium]|nr:hypothetical protein [Clostridiales bacterium]
MCVVVAVIVISKTDIFSSAGKVEDGTIKFSDESNRIEDVPEGEALFNMNTEVTFERSRSVGNIMIENPESSEYTIVVKIYYYNDSVSRVIYESDKIKPGQYILGDKLDYKLTQGTYTCYYNAEAYKDGVFVGKTDAQPMTITVQK